MSLDRNLLLEMLRDSLPLEGTLFAVDLTVSDSVRPKVTVTLDGEQGLGIDECAQVSRRLARRIEEHYGDELSYTLEVTSPGADQPLRDPRQYVRHVGRTLHLKLQDGTEKTGKLEAISPEGGSIELAEILKEKHKEKMLPAVTVPFQDITEAVVVISFK
ncbi:ribosome maturation factor [Hymenobacter sp. ISL-91]|uniref:ribosome maturation factor RimP n=1 Tax=Hymenobacter sp. ISL-91 TaxID=2819151 RepID=UPI001BEBE6AC|nr:ribosome maturation factor [Hymenobacter sp. ISL-91]MBT2556186.1 ribosome maturation factor [Hymenobacter sp. ISL-91]